MAKEDVAMPTEALELVNADSVAKEDVVMPTKALELVNTDTVAKEDLVTHTQVLEFGKTELDYQFGPPDFVTSSNSRGLQVSRGKLKAKVGKRTRQCCCNNTWVEFTENTSLHGLKYIWMKDVFVYRRYVLTGWSFFVYRI